MNTFIINNNAEKYISLQRTGYGDADIARSYYKDILKDYESIKSVLPDECSRCLDIGCGIGGIDISLYNHYNGNIKLDLIDYTGIDEDLHYGFRDKASIYNNLDLTAQFLGDNGVHNYSIYDATNWRFDKQYEIIISLLSCGFHYPIETYLNQIKKHKAGVVILDIRKGTKQKETLKDNFNKVEVLMEWSKGERLLIE